MLARFCLPLIGDESLLCSTCHSTAPHSTRRNGTLLNDHSWLRTIRKTFLTTRRGMLFICITSAAGSKPRLRATFESALARSRRFSAVTDTSLKDQLCLPSKFGVAREFRPMLMYVLLLSRTIPIDGPSSSSWLDWYVLELSFFIPLAILSLCRCPAWLLNVTKTPT